ncbi:helix-turn-helix domain-containing protein [Sanguibacter sp. 25GB23B1]|uniref:ArsR/SmtB family transcription factor n=1 Tax=unclassified Sanguibacter TaxID=2645534 RepID=UPI0032AF52A7
MRTISHPDRSALRLDAVLAALSDPVRRSIVSRLAERADGHSCQTFELPVAKSTATHHFRVLRESGVIRQEYHGTSIMNSLRAGDLDDRFPGLLSAVLAAQRAESAADRRCDGAAERATPPSADPA